MFPEWSHSPQPHPLFQPKPGNIGWSSVPPRIQDFLSNLILTRLGLSQGSGNFPSEELHGAFPFFSPSFPFFFSIQTWDLMLPLSPRSQISWQGSLGTSWVLMGPRCSLSFHPSSSRFPSDSHEIFPHFPPKKHQFCVSGCSEEYRSW